MSFENLRVIAMVAGGVGFVLALEKSVHPVVGRAASRIVAHVRGWIPPASAESAALFRIVFGTALLLFLLRSPFVAAWASDPSNRVSDAQQQVLRVFAAAPWSVQWLKAWFVAWGLLVIVGAATRMSFAMLTVGVFMWAILYTTHVSHHTVSALLMTLVCLLWARWGDAWSLDVWLRRKQPEPRGLPQEYGYAVWIPSFVLGVSFAAAAFSKLWSGGLGWVLNGTVKYHFLSDSDQAMVDWGLQLGRHPLVAVLLSFGAIATEMLVIVGVISGAYRYRVLAGLAALSLLGGFALLQGVVWPGWWILLLSFLPWHRVRPIVAGRVAARSADLRGSPQSWAIVGVLIALIGEQFAVSMFGLERSPLISSYDMYSTTYSSPASYENKAREYWVVAVDDTANVHDCRITHEQANAILRVGDDPSQPELRARVLQRCFQSIRVASVTVDVSQAAVDWERWRLNTPARTRIMPPVPADTLQ